MALYHQYRPQKFSDIIGQDHIVKTLSNEVVTGKIAHAYLFSGPRGTGKTSTARILAKALNCPNRKENKTEPCNDCHSCQEISNSRSIDVIEIDAASHTGVDNVRENIIDSTQFRPTKSKYKVFIIDEAHMLSGAAFNALLKTLEEPPEYIVFILATTELNKLPATIVSRCQRFAFHRLTATDIKKNLEHIAKEEGVKIDKEVIERIINKSEGAARDSVSLLDQLISTGEKNIDLEIANLILPTTDVEKTLKFLGQILKKETKEAILLINEIAEEGSNLFYFCEDLIQLLRLVLVYQASGTTKGSVLDLDDKAEKEIKKLSDLIPGSDLLDLIDIFLARRLQIKSAPLPQLPLEMAIIGWCEKDLRSSKTTKDEPVAPQEKKTLTPPPISKKEDTTPADKKTITERVKEMVNKPTLEKSLVLEKWEVFILEIEKKFPSLSFILKMAEFHDIENNVVKIAVEYSFHRDKLMEKTYQYQLEEILSELCDTKVKIEAVVTEKTCPTADEELEKLASTMGGEIIN